MLELKSVALVFRGGGGVCFIIHFPMFLNLFIKYSLQHGC